MPMWKWEEEGKLTWIEMLPYKILRWLFGGTPIARETSYLEFVYLN